MVRMARRKSSRRKIVVNDKHYKWQVNANGDVRIWNADKKVVARTTAWNMNGYTMDDWFDVARCGCCRTWSENPTKAMLKPSDVARYILKHIEETNA